ncbi:hypothetical protein F4813DRAFT_367087 [Daldinia decipiens]|uniref:uncharacterized protein n=1 Tax=Daldinia decipiens TaxID=326647 RepID=UPI0020C36945|nr:uncharacterized protein F4813DRAFT_367087 [Daldinia decipiens]KAI1655462.1 hypothetical protein F4813DRAFT_367087 [Daldinia decipiens]
MAVPESECNYLPIGDGDHETPQQPKFRIRFGKPFGFIFIIVQIVELSAILLLTVSLHQARQDIPRPYLALHDYAKTVDFDVIFHHEDIDARIYNHTFWRSFIPDSGGIVSIPSTSTIVPNQATMSSPLDSSHLLYQVSVFHSLHCLEAVKWALTGEGDKYNLPDLRTVHAPHCIDWIRQELMCNADLTLNTMYQEITVPHKCRDFDRILDWTKKNSFNGSLDSIGLHSSQSHDGS